MKMISSVVSFFRHRIGLFFFFSFSLACALLLFSFSLFPAWAEWFATHPAALVRRILGGISSLFPFSLFEILIGLFFLYLVFLLCLLCLSWVRRIQKRTLPRRVGALCLAVPVVLCTVADLFVLSFASSYHRNSVAQAMELDVKNVSREEVFFALEKIVRTINEAAPSLPLNENGESLAPEFSQVKEAVVSAADGFGEKHAFYQSFGYPSKEFLVSPWMTYTHIAGVFGFFTGEANVNTNYPHFVVTASMAHEICHARGIGPENECNFLAAVLLMESEDPYLRYCGAASLADDMISACRKIDRDRANTILKSLDPVYWKDQSAYSRFFDPYRDSTASKVANAANDAYLKAQGQEGVISYSRVQSLTAAYFQAQQKGTLPS